MTIKSVRNENFQTMLQRIELLKKQKLGERANRTSHFIERAACLCHARRDNLCEIVDLGASAGEVVNGTAILSNAVDDAIEGARGKFVDEAGDIGGGGS